jgi:hypothetical protein
MKHSTKDKLKQYGLKNSIIRSFKALLRKLGFKFEKSIYISKEITGKVSPPEPKIKLEVKELDYDDIKNNSYLTFEEDKLLLFKKRLTTEGYLALGAYFEDKLVYVCWISLKKFESSRDLQNKITLEKEDGLMLDAYTHPKKRGLGIHSYMNGIRFNRIFELGKKKAIGLVLMENIPARKAQAKLGFKADKIVSYKKIFNKEYVKVQNKKVEL